MRCKIVCIIKTHMLTLIMWHNRLVKTKSRPWRHIYHDTEIPRPKNHDIEIPRPKSHDIEIPRPESHHIEIPRPKSHDIEIPRPKSHDIEIPRPKSHDIEFLWNLTLEFPDKFWAAGACSILKYSTRLLCIYPRCYYMDQNYIVSSRGKGNLIFCFTGSQENHFGSIGWQNNNNPTFQGQHKLTNSTCVRPRRE